MNRLTKNMDTQYDFIGSYDTNIEEFTNNKKLRISVMNKLGQLEDIEEEIGIDLITLNKLRKADKIYVKFFDDIQEWNKTKVDLRYCKIWYGYISGKGYCLSQPLSNYGTGFALTREELKNDINLH